MLLSIFVVLAAFSEVLSSSVNKQCRDLLTCSIKKKCVNLPWLVDKMMGKEVGIQMYNDIDTATDYGCIFTSGCLEECNKCPLCFNSKMQVVEILSGNQFEKEMECSDLLSCASKCVEKSAEDIGMINHCLRHTCALHCFDGSCQKCSAFVTRVFNQMCVSGNLKSNVKGFSGQCYELFRDIVYSKFKEQFDERKIKPAIGKKTEAI